MAGLTWFELDVDFPDHPKTIELCARLKDQNAGMYVVRVWRYCYKHARDRFGGEAAVTTIEQAAAWRGKRGRLVDVLQAVEFIEVDAGGALVIHGVEERLAPHLAKREADRTRIQEKREAAAKGIRAREGAAQKSRRCRRDIAETSQPSREDVAGYTDHHHHRDKDSSDPEGKDPVIASEPLPPDDGSGLASVCERLAQAQGLPRVTIGSGEKAARVPGSFGRWLRLAGEDALVAECLRLARERGQRVGHLSWFPGFLDSASDDDLRAVRVEGAAA